MVNKSSWRHSAGWNVRWPFNERVKGSQELIFQQDSDPAWQLHFQAPFKLNLYSVPCPVIISQTAAAIALFVLTSLCSSDLWQLHTFFFTVCLHCDSICFFKGLCVQSASQLLNRQAGRAAAIRERVSSRQVQHGWWILKIWDNMWGQQLSLFQVTSPLCLCLSLFTRVKAPHCGLLSKWISLSGRVHFDFVLIVLNTDTRVASGGRRVQ